jgi:hypothetical protein
VLLGDAALGTGVHGLGVALLEVGELARRGVRVQVRAGLIAGLRAV